MLSHFSSGYEWIIASSLNEVINLNCEILTLISRKNAGTSAEMILQRGDSRHT
jgi:hypothetical protein